MHTLSKYNRKINIKESLENIRQLKIEIEEQEERLVRYEETAYNLTSSLSSLGPTSSIKSHNVADMMAESVAKMIDLNKYINRILSDYYYSIEEIEKAMEILSSLQRRIIRLYYIDGLAADQVAAEIGYDRRSFYRIRKKALEILESNMISK